MQDILFFYTAHHVLLTPLPFHFYFFNSFLLLFPPQFHYYFPSSFTATTTTSTTFLLLSLHHHHHYIPIVFPPPPHFYCFHSSLFSCQKGYLNFNLFGPSLAFQARFWLFQPDGKSLKSSAWLAVVMKIPLTAILASLDHFYWIYGASSWDGRLQSPQPSNFSYCQYNSKS